MSNDQTDDRWARVADLLADVDGESLGESACRASDQLLGVDRSALSLVIDHTASPIGATDEIARELDEQQFVVNDGPTVECISSDAPVLVDDIERARVDRPGFASIATASGALAAFAFPLRIGASRLGALTSYRNHPGGLSSEQYADGLVLASMVTILLLVHQANEPPGITAKLFQDGLEEQAIIQRAAGMVTEQLDVSIVDALVVIRSRAFSTSNSIRKVAEGIILRTLDLRGGERPPGPQPGGASPDTDHRKD